MPLWPWLAFCEALGLLFIARSERVAHTTIQAPYNSLGQKFNWFDSQYCRWRWLNELHMRIKKFAFLSAMCRISIEKLYYSASKSINSSNTFPGHPSMALLFASWHFCGNQFQHLLRGLSIFCQKKKIIIQPNYECQIMKYECQK